MTNLRVRKVADQLNFFLTHRAMLGLAKSKLEMQHQTQLQLAVPLANALCLLRCKGEALEPGLFALQWLAELPVHGVGVFPEALRSGGPWRTLPSRKLRIAMIVFWLYTICSRSANQTHPHLPCAGGGLISRAHASARRMLGRLPGAQQLPQQFVSLKMCSLIGSRQAQSHMCRRRHGLRSG